MKQFQLSPERVHLLQKVAKKEKDPVEILACTIFGTCLFIFVYRIVASEFRHEEWLSAMVMGPTVALGICLFLSRIAYQKMKHSLAGERRNLFVNLVVCSWCALIAGYLLGDRSYWQYTTNIYSYRDLVSYVDIDPVLDNGQSYMDSGHVYFKEHTYVLRQKFNKFQNGDIYCVAPIVRGGAAAAPPASAQADSGRMYDWWAVGTNCCDGTGAKNFTCGEVKNPLARSGMRLLSDTQRPYYLLAVQEWSATYGLPVRHPLFFTWVKDPLETEDSLEQQSDADFWMYTWYCVLGTFIVSFLLHMVMHRNKIY